MEERGRWREAAPEVLKDYIHAVNVHLLDGLLEPPGEVQYGFLLLLYNSLQIVIFLLCRTKQKYSEMNTVQISLNEFIELYGSL